MSVLTVDLSAVESDIRDFPDGAVEAEITEASLEVSKKGNAMIALRFKVFHPEHGTATVRDWLVPSFANKVAKFVKAFNGLTQEELKAYENVDLDPTELKGGRMIVVLGTDDNGYKTIAPPWYFAETEVDVLPYMQEEVL